MSFPVSKSPNSTTNNPHSSPQNSQIGNETKQFFIDLGSAITESPVWDIFKKKKPSENIAISEGTTSTYSEEEELSTPATTSELPETDETDDDNISTPSTTAVGESENLQPSETTNLTGSSNPLNLEKDTRNPEHAVNVSGLTVSPSFANKAYNNIIKNTKNPGTQTSIKHADHAETTTSPESTLNHKEKPTNKFFNWVQQHLKVNSRDSTRSDRPFNTDHNSNLSRTGINTLSRSSSQQREHINDTNIVVPAPGATVSHIFADKAHNKISKNIKTPGIPQNTKHADHAHTTESITPVPFQEQETSNKFPNLFRKGHKTEEGESTESISLSRIDSPPSQTLATINPPHPDVSWSEMFAKNIEAALKPSPTQKASASDNKLHNKITEPTKKKISSASKKQVEHPQCGNSTRPIAVPKKYTTSRSSHSSKKEASNIHSSSGTESSFNATQSRMSILSRQKYSCDRNTSNLHKTKNTCIKKESSTSDDKLYNKIKTPTHTTTAPAPGKYMTYAQYLESIKPVSHQKQNNATKKSKCAKKDAGVKSNRFTFSDSSSDNESFSSTDSSSTSASCSSTDSCFSIDSSSNSIESKISISAPAFLSSEGNIYNTEEVVQIHKGKELCSLEDTLHHEILKPIQTPTSSTRKNHTDCTRTTPVIESLALTTEPTTTSDSDSDSCIQEDEWDGSDFSASSSFSDSSITTMPVSTPATSPCSSSLDSTECSKNSKSVSDTSNKKKTHISNPLPPVRYTGPTPTPILSKRNRKARHTTPSRSSKHISFLNGNSIASSFTWTVIENEDEDEYDAGEVTIYNENSNVSLSLSLSQDTTSTSISASIYPEESMETSELTGNLSYTQTFVDYGRTNFLNDAEGIPPFLRSLINTHASRTEASESIDDMSFPTHDTPTKVSHRSRKERASTRNDFRESTRLSITDLPSTGPSAPKTPLPHKRVPSTKHVKNSQLIIPTSTSSSKDTPAATIEEYSSDSESYSQCSFEDEVNECVSRILSKASGSHDLSFSSHTSKHRRDFSTKSILKPSMYKGSNREDISQVEISHDDTFELSDCYELSSSSFSEDYNTDEVTINSSERRESKDASRVSMRLDTCLSDSVYESSSDEEISDISGYVLQFLDKLKKKAGNNTINISNDGDDYEEEGSNNYNDVVEKRESYNYKENDSKDTHFIFEESNSQKRYDDNSENRDFTFKDSSVEDCFGDDAVRDARIAEQNRLDADLVGISPRALSETISNFKFPKNYGYDDTSEDMEEEVEKKIERILGGSKRKSSMFTSSSGSQKTRRHHSHRSSARTSRCSAI